jgi:tetratricopeptide (TPR) repeat protein
MIDASVRSAGPRRPLLPARTRAVAARAGARVMLLGLILASGTACKRAPHEGPRAAPTPLGVSVSGCARVTRAIDCVVGDDRTFHMWIPEARPGSVAAFDAQTPVTLPAARDVQAGLAFDVTLPEGSRALRVTATRIDGTVGEHVVTLAPDDAPAWLHEAASLRGEGKLDDAEKRLAPGLAEGATDVHRAWATAMVARIELRRGHLDRAASLFHDAIALDRRAGLVSDEGKDTAALVFLLAVRRNDSAAAERALDEVSEAMARDVEGVMNLRYYRGIVAHAGGDWRASLRLFDEVRSEAERLSIPEAGRDASVQSALALEYQGRWRESLAILEAVERQDPPDTPGCVRAVLLANIGEGRLLAAEAGATSSVGDPLPPLEEAIRIDGTTCPDGFARAMSLSDAALALFRRGELARAKAYLVDARKAAPEPDPYLETSLAEVEGRIALAERRFASARDAFAREERIASVSLFQVERWRAAYGRGEALEALGATGEAIAAYVAAERSLDESILDVPLGEGQGGFAADREASARALVDLLVRVKRPADALVHARNARVRVLSALARTARVEALEGESRKRWAAALDDYRRARQALTADAGDDWQRPQDLVASAMRRRRDADARARLALDAALGPIASAVASDRRSYAPLPAGALLIAYAPVRDGWVALAATRARARAVPFALPAAGATPVALAAAFVAPFAAEIRAADEVLLAPHGAARAIDIHALLHDGAPLAASRPVRYVLDVGTPSTVESSDARAVVLSDPTSDLEAARAEGVLVTAALEASRVWPVLALTGLEVTPARMVAELPTAALLHFAGHGVYGGREGWESALPLARGARWTVGDVLALPRAPMRVVLSACEGARSSLEAAEGLGLAQAFLLAGAGAAVAPTRPVKDELARALSEALYASLLQKRSPSVSLPTALGDAQRALAAAHPDWDWAALRALTP